MLQTIRDRLTGWVAVAILLIIALALVVTFGNMNSDVATGDSRPRSTVTRFQCWSFVRPTRTSY